MSKCKKAQMTNISNHIQYSIVKIRNNRWWILITGKTSIRLLKVPWIWFFKGLRCIILSHVFFELSFMFFSPSIRFSLCQYVIQFCIFRRFGISRYLIKVMVTVSLARSLRLTLASAFSFIRNVSYCLWNCCSFNLNFLTFSQQSHL